MQKIFSWKQMSPNRTHANFVYKLWIWVIDWSRRVSTWTCPRWKIKPTHSTGGFTYVCNKWTVEKNIIDNFKLNLHATWGASPIPFIVRKQWIIWPRDQWAQIFRVCLCNRICRRKVRRQSGAFLIAFGATTKRPIHLFWPHFLLWRGSGNPAIPGRTSGAEKETPWLYTSTP